MPKADPCTEGEEAICNAKCGNSCVSQPKGFSPFLLCQNCTRIQYSRHSGYLLSESRLPDLLEHKGALI